MAEAFYELRSLMQEKNLQLVKHTLEFPSMFMPAVQFYRFC